MSETLVISLAVAANAAFLVVFLVRIAIDQFRK